LLTLIHTCVRSRPNVSATSITIEVVTAFGERNLSFLGKKGPNPLGAAGLAPYP